MVPCDIIGDTIIKSDLCIFLQNPPQNSVFKSGTRKNGFINQEIIKRIRNLDDEIT